MKPLSELKNELKALAVTIRELKSHRPQENRGTWRITDLDYEIRRTSWTTRHKHIAYCLMRGRSYDEIEKRTRDDNKPNLKLIQEIQNEYADTANVCPCP